VCRKVDSIDILREITGDLGITEEPISNYYSLGKILGSGKYGVVRQGISLKNPNFKCAIKVIDMNKLSSQLHSLIQEILTLKKVDHPNIVSISEMFKDEDKLYLVMEYVEGQELFDFVTERFKLLESEACDIIEQLVKVIRYLNSIGVCHRDLKPENIIINKDTLQIKLIDFGLSAYFDDSSQLNSKVGTPYYVAPEVLDGKYHKECDMWSIGVITYILLVGYPPFNSKNMRVIYEKIRKAKPEYYQAEWENLSKEALDFTNRLLQKDLKKRMSPGKALCHNWIENKTNFDGEVSPNVLRRLANFTSPDKLKKEIFQFLACNLKTETMNQMNTYFNSLDKEKTGMISIEHVLNKFEELNYRSSRLTMLRELHAKNKNLKINYSDFMTRVVDITREVEHDDLVKAFQHFDSDNSGKITKEDLKNLMKRKGENLSDDEIEELLHQVDSCAEEDSKSNDRTEINFDTFKNYIYKLSPMSPSLRVNDFKSRVREDQLSMDMMDATTHAPSGNRNMSMNKSNCSDDSRKSVDFVVAFESD